MKTIFLFEVRHYIHSAIGISVLALFSLIYSQHASFSISVSLPYTIVWGLAMAVAVGFGAWQSYYHKSNGRWVFLIHRPVSLANIFAALLLSAAVLIFVATILPALAVLLYADLFTDKLVEVRHYLFLVVVFLCSLCGYLVASLTIRGVNKGAVFIFVTLVILWMSNAPLSNWGVILPIIISLLILLYLNYKSIKPDLTSAPNEILEVSLSYLMMSIGLHIVVVVLISIFFHASQIISNQDNRLSTLSFEGFQEVTTSNDRMALALQNTDNPRAKSVLAQIALSESDRLALNTFQFPFFNITPDRMRSAELQDAKSRQTWKFSHHKGIFIGFEETTGESIGILTPQGFQTGDIGTVTTPFTHVPISLGGGIFMTEKAIYAADFEYRTVTTLFETEENERFTDRPKQTRGSLIIPTNTRLLVFNQSIALHEEIAEPLVNIEYPVNHRQIEEIWLYELPEGFAVIFAGEHLFGYEKAGTSASFTAFDNTTYLLNEVLMSDYRLPLWFRQLEEIVSPTTLYLSDLMRHTLNPNAIENSAPVTPLSRFESISVHLHILIALVLSTVCSFLLARRLRLAKPMVLTWALLSAVFGITVCAAMVFVYLVPNPQKALRQASFIHKLKPAVEK